MSNTLKAGDVVEVRSASEILATLDDQACLENLPFMPEMIPFIGGTYRVSKRAHKTCDTVHQTGGRRLTDCVHLEDQRCDGSGHDGCKATCLLFWKTDWLRPVQGNSRVETDAPPVSSDDLRALTELSQASIKRRKNGDEPIYRCQATALYDSTTPLPWYDLRQYAEDLRSGNTSLGQMLRIWFFHGLYKLMGLGIAYGVWERLYDTAQTRIGGYKNPFREGLIPEGEKTPIMKLDLMPGEKVRVRPHDEILATLDKSGKNRGMRFDAEMVPYCGSTFTVQQRVDKIIHETTGEMIDIKSPSVILDGVVCRSEMSPCRLFCPRAIPSYWREIWLERLNSSVDDARKT